MPITITAVPVVVATPGFAGDTIRVPLSAEPSAMWLDQLRRQELPGKAHRVDGAALEFYLDHDTRDVIKAMQRIAKAINAADQAFDADAAATVESEIETEQDDRRRRIERLLQQWWEQEVERRERQRLRAQALAGAGAAEAETTPAPEAAAEARDPSGDTPASEGPDVVTEGPPTNEPAPNTEAPQSGADPPEAGTTPDA